MAQAQIVTETVETHTITLTLTLEEAQAVKSVLGRVGGCSAQRDASEGVYTALTKALKQVGTDVASWRDDNRFHVGGDSLYFTNPEPNGYGKANNMVH